MVIHIPQVLGDSQLATMRAALNSDQAPWVDGRVTAGHQGVAVKKNQQLDAASPMAHELGCLVLAELERNALFISAVLPNRVFPPMFNRYGDGMHFGTHVDGAVRMIPGSPQKLRTDLSATLFLAPPESYDGGELVVENDFGSQSTKLAAGDMVVYPATARHHVVAVTRGLRTACVFLGAKSGSQRARADAAVRTGSHDSTTHPKRRGLRIDGPLGGPLPQPASPLDGNLENPPAA